MRIKNYILFGQGRGLKPFFWVSFLFATLIGMLMYFMVSTFAKMPEITGFIKELPTITMDGGKITSPQNTFTQLPMPFLRQSYFILNTLDNPDFTLNFDVGLYLTKDMIYFKYFDRVQVEKLSFFFGDGALTLSPEVITKTLTLAAVLFGLLYFAILLFSLWGAWLVVNLCTWLILWLCGKFVCPLVRSRAVSVVLIGLSVTQLILLLFYIPFNLLFFIILGIALSIIVLWQTPLHSQMVEDNLIALKEAEEPQPTIIPAVPAKVPPKTVKKAKKQSAKKTTSKSTKVVKPAKSAQRKKVVKPVKSAKTKGTRRK